MSSTKRNRILALVDCNSFYVSCERLFQPKWRYRPVVVLSNNDGCVVARSKEAKTLGIPMGAPVFKYRELFRKHAVVACSSNYALYGDLSQRIMKILSNFTSDLQVYSIDEAFLELYTDTPIERAREIKETIAQHVGIPVSIGLGSTKTLAKAANELAKKQTEGVFSLLDPSLHQTVLSNFPLSDIWGIGSRLQERLLLGQIRNAWELRNAPDAWVRKHLSVTGLRTAWELRGISCLSLDEIAPDKKSITSSRSFGAPVTEKEELAQALATFTATAAEKLRAQKYLASYILVFLVSFPRIQNYYPHYQVVSRLSEPTDFTPALIEAGKLALDQLYRQQVSYKKVGIILGDLIPQEQFQPDLFFSSQHLRSRQRSAMEILDQINRKYGKKTVRFAAEGFTQNWKMRRDKLSNRFTTCWEELLTIKI